MPDTGRQPPPAAGTRDTGRRSPRPWLAVLLGLWAVGLGQLYAGSWRRAVGLWAASIAFFLAAVYSPILATFAGLVVWLIAGLAFLAWTLIDAARLARAWRGAARPGWSRWYAVVGLGVASAVVAWALASLPWRYRAFYLPSGSMEPALVVGDRLVARMLEPGEAAPARGDIVLFLWGDQPTSVHLDRVVGLPGETIEIRAKRVRIDGRELDDPWAAHLDERIYPPTPLLDDFRGRRDSFGPLTIPDGEYFLLGDNRDFSHDSRFRGTVHGAWIVGRPLYLYWAKDRSRIGKTVR